MNNADTTKLLEKLKSNFTFQYFIAKIPNYEVALTKELCKYLRPDLNFNLDSTFDDKIRMTRMAIRLNHPICASCNTMNTMKDSIRCPDCRITFYCAKPECYTMMNTVEHLVHCANFPVISPPIDQYYTIDVVTKLENTYFLHTIHPNTKIIESRPLPIYFSDEPMLILDITSLLM